MSTKTAIDVQQPLARQFLCVVLRSSAAAQVMLGAIIIPELFSRVCMSLHSVSYYLVKSDVCCSSNIVKIVHFMYPRMAKAPTWMSS